MKGQWLPASVGAPPEVVSSPDPTQEERIWWRLADPWGWLLFWREISLCQITLQKTQSEVHHYTCQWKSLATSAWHSTFWVRKLVISSQLCNSKLRIFNKAWGISRKSPDPLLTGGVWGWDYPTGGLTLVMSYTSIHDPDCQVNC